MAATLERTGTEELSEAREKTGTVMGTVATIQENSWCELRKRVEEDAQRALLLRSALLAVSPCLPVPRAASLVTAAWHCKHE